MVTYIRCLEVTSEGYLVSQDTRFGAMVRSAFECFGQRNAEDSGWVVDCICWLVGKETIMANKAGRPKSLERRIAENIIEQIADHKNLEELGYDVCMGDVGAYTDNAYITKDDSINVKRIVSIVMKPIKADIQETVAQIVERSVINCVEDFDERLE